VPANLPSELQVLGTRVGRTIIQKDATTTETTSEFATIYQAGTATLHNDLGGLNMGDFQHLTVAEKDNIVTKTGTQTITGLKNQGSVSNSATLTLYGTSIGSNFGFDNTWSYSDNYGYKLNRLLNTVFTNISSSGKKLQQAVAGVPDNSIYSDRNNFPNYTLGSILALEVGINDAIDADTVTFNTSEYQTQLTAVINTALSKGYPANKIFLLTAFYWSAGSGARADAYNAVTASVASTFGTIYFDGYNTYKALVPGTYTLDGAGLHPAKSTHTVIANDMFTTIFGSVALNKSSLISNIYDAQNIYGDLTVKGYAYLNGETTLKNVKLDVNKLIGGNNTGDLYTRDSSGYVAPIPSGSSGQYLMSNGASTLSTYSTISKSTIGLSNVDNTSDLNKPISTATQTALNVNTAAIALKANDNNVVHLNGTENITGQKTFNPSVSASASVARGSYFTPTLTATANNDELVGLQVSPSFANGAFTGVNNISIKAGQLGLGSKNRAGATGSNAYVSYGSAGGSGIYPFATNGVLVLESRTNNNADIAFLSGTASDVRGYFSGATGNFHIGYTSGTDNGFKLDVNGTSRFQSTVTLGTLPTTSAGTYDFLARNTSTGVVEKIPSANVAPTVSPNLTGNPTATTATVGDNDTSIATTAFVNNVLSSTNSFSGNSAGLIRTTFENTNNTGASDRDIAIMLYL